MGSDVLVLNRSFYAIQVISWQRALSLVYLDHAHVVDEDYRCYSFEDWRELSKIIDTNPSGFVHTPALKIAIPDVIALRCYDRLPASEVKFTRRNIYEHYRYQCCYCGKKLGSVELNLDHILPRSRGGKTNWENIVTSCIPCNLRKGSRLPEEANMKLLVKPSKPAWRGPMSLVFASPAKMKTSWQRFVDTMYWNVELDQEIIDTVTR
jgi:5-methylcytosine-specific restriction endonuclease McrA